MSKSVNIICAPTGRVHTPTTSHHLPITPGEIATASIEAAEAGASIIHFVAIPDEARERLGLQGRDRVGY